jgi:DNA polymerase-4
MARSIIHVDMDAFYASVEQRDHPELRGRPVMVGGGRARGVVAAASYEARQFGVRSAMPGRTAHRLCPHGVFVRARFERYREISATVFGFFHELTDQVEGLSLDEAFLDVSDAVRNGQALASIGRDLKLRISQDLGLSASVGMAHNKLLAKLASDYDKPDGLVHVPPDGVHRFLDPLPVRRLWGIGPKTTEKLHDAGIFTAGQLRKTATDVLVELFGSSGPELAARAAGIDERPVKPGRRRRSVSQENTFSEDLTTLEQLLPVIRDQSRSVAETLRNKQLHARTVVLKLRSSSFSTLTRSQTLPGYTREARLIEETATELLQAWLTWHPEFAIRLLGVGVSGLVSQPDDSSWLTTQNDTSGD